MITLRSSPSPITAAVAGRPPEDAILLLCCRDHLDKERRQLLGQAIDARPDWDRLARKATYHRLLGFLQYHLGREGHLDGAVPHELRDTLDEGIVEAEAGLQRQLRSLQTCAGALERGDIRYLLLKGPVLQQLYPPGVVRVAGDLDIIVSEDDLDAIIVALCAEGFALATRTPPGLGAREAVEFAQYLEQLRFVHPDLGEVELHFRVYNYGIPEATETVWQRWREWPVGERDYPSLTPEELLLYLASHLNLHAFGRILWYYDLSAFYLQWRESIDWELLAARARERQLTSSFFHSLTWICALLHPECPLPELERLRPSALHSRLYSLLWRKTDVFALKSYIRPFDAATYYLLGRASVIDKLRYLWRIFFPPSRWLGPYLQRPPSAWLLNWSYLRQRRRETRGWNRITRREELLG